MAEAAGPLLGSGTAALTSVHQSEDTFRCKAAGVGTVGEQESLAVKLLAFHDVREDLQAPRGAGRSSGLAVVQSSL